MTLKTYWTDRHGATVIHSPTLPPIDSRLPARTTQPTRRLIATEAPLTGSAPRWRFSRSMRIKEPGAAPGRHRTALSSNRRCTLRQTWQGSPFSGSTPRPCPSTSSAAACPCRPPDSPGTPSCISDGIRPFGLRRQGAASSSRTVCGTTLAVLVTSWRWQHHALRPMHSKWSF